MFTLTLMFCAGLKCGLMQMPTQYATYDACMKDGLDNSARINGARLHGDMTGGMSLEGFACPAGGSDGLAELKEKMEAAANSKVTVNKAVIHAK